ncbi:MAG: hypothetical protein ACN6O6_17420 [Pseudomonas sp.]|uniref:hypothetical protein n=1 Tax=Pseudomonas sp. TaxID=306 RepID=UPI003D0C0FBB
MTALKPLLLATALMVLGGCTLHPVTTPDTPDVPVTKSHPRFAPPPGAQSHWDASLGVYVISGERDTFYRERTYYRWNKGWSWATNPNGPWQPTDSSGIPPGLYRQYAQ